MRKFEQVDKRYKMHYEDVELPIRADKGSAGYDFVCPQRIVLASGETTSIPTDIKASMESDEVLLLFVRSSIGIKKGLVLTNGTGVIDSSYYNNINNNGNIIIALKNTSAVTQIVEKGERIMQGVFVKYLTTDNDSVLHSERKGGVGSSGI